jgi:subtilisin family serine protease
MKKLPLLIAVFFVGILLTGCSQKNEILPVDGKNADLKSADISDLSVSGKYIVVLKTDAALIKSGFADRNEKIKGKAGVLLKKTGITGQPEEVYETALQGFTARLTPGQAKKLSEDPAVKSIEADQVVSLSPVSVMGKTVLSASQQIPWGITRVGGGVTTDLGTKTAWIIDTGIDFSHPDLNVDIQRSATFLKTNTTPEDENGHGTHVAGIIGAKDNNMGVIGVAPGATLVSVRVLDKKGNGTISAVIAGINYVAANGTVGDVANLSLGVSAYQALDDAVLTASEKIKFVLAAGNSAVDAANLSPARVNGPNIYTVSAMDNADNWAYFSNFGNPPVDYCAPGVSVFSTYKGGIYATMSGTSQAAPHVTGLLLLGSLKPDGKVNGDPDGKPDPIAHR